MTPRMNQLVRQYMVLLLVAAPLTATAQRGMGGGMGGMGGGGGMGRGGGGGGRRHGGGEGSHHSDESAMAAARDSLLERIGFAGFVLMHKSDLTLTDSQTVTLSAIDSTFHAIADTTRPRLDTLRADNAALVQRMTHASIGDTLTTAERDSVITRRKTMSQLATALRAVEQETQAKATNVLSTTQRGTVTTLLNKVGAPEERRRGRPSADSSGAMPGGTP